MSLLTQAWLLEKYGPRLTIDQLAEVLDLEPRTIYNQVSAGSLGIPTYKDGAKRFADIRDVSAYLDECRGRAKAAA